MLFPRRRVVLSGSALLAAQAVAGALGPGLAADARKRVAFANVDDASAFGAAVLRGMKSAAASRPRLDVTAFDNRADVAHAVEIARTIAAARYDLFIEYNGQSASNLPISRLMDTAGIKVLAVQVPVPGAPLFAVDNRAAGTDSGKALALEFKRRWPAERPVVVIFGLPEAGPLFKDRGDAAKAAVAEVFPGIAFDELSSKGDAGYVRQTTSDLLTRNPGRKMMLWAHVDEIALAAVSGIKNSNRAEDVIVATTGGSAAVFPEIKRAGSPLLGTYSFFPELWGGDILDLADKILAGETIQPRTIPRQQLFISAQNIAQYEAKI